MLRIKLVTRYSLFIKLFGLVLALLRLRSKWFFFLRDEFFLKHIFSINIHYRQIHQIISFFLHLSFTPEAYVEPSLTYAMEPLTSFVKISILDIRVSSKYASVHGSFNDLIFSIISSLLVCHILAIYNPI